MIYHWLIISSTLKISTTFWQLNYYAYASNEMICSIFVTRVFRTFSNLCSLSHSPLLGNGTQNGFAEHTRQLQEFNFLPVFSRSDDNSNQSSIADSSPVKQENSCSTSPTPEPTTVPHRENSEAKTDQSPDSKRGETQKRQTRRVAPAACM